MPDPAPARPTPRAAVILLAAGEGRRVGAETNKVLLPLAGLPVFAWSLRALREIEYVDQVVVVVREADRDVVASSIGSHFAAMPIQVVAGGDTRHGSEWNALQAIADLVDDGAIDVVAIHDAARPLAGSALFREVIVAAAEHGGALPVREQRHLLPREHPDSDDTRQQDSTLVAVQTPQAFRAQPLLDAYRRSRRDGFVGTDTASCVEEYTDLEIRPVPCLATNLKITFPEDAAVAERLLHNATGAGAG